MGPGDHQLHPANGHGFNSGNGGVAMWGNYRSLEPLHLLVHPAQQIDLMRSYTILYEQTGRMMGFGRGLSGHHVIAMALDMYKKGYRDFDAAKLYEGFKKLQTEETFLPWRDVPQTSLDRVYLEKGFFPALKKGEEETVKEVHPFERRQAVAVTLDSAYDDWCMSEWAKLLGKQDDYEYFPQAGAQLRECLRQAHWLHGSEVGGRRMGPRPPTEYSPIWSGGQGGREYYSEMNGWIFTFSVQHDLAGLINLMGGRDKFADKLDTLFQDQFEGYSCRSLCRFAEGRLEVLLLAQFPDQTGLIGQYAIGDEPGLHIPYLYNYAGQPWKTQRRVRDIMKIWYNSGPTGLPRG